MKFGPVEIGSWKWEMAFDKKDTFEQQLLEARTDVAMQLNHLKELSEGYRRSIRYNELKGRDTEEDMEELGITLKAIYVVKMAEKQLRKIASRQELNKTLSSLNESLLKINKLDKAKARSSASMLERNLGRMLKNTPKDADERLFSDISIDDDAMRRYIKGEVPLDRLMYDLDKHEGEYNPSGSGMSRRKYMKNEQDFIDDESPIEEDFTKKAQTEEAVNDEKARTLKEEMRKRGI